MKWQNANGKEYSPEELAAMQKDAMERVREMQRRADETLRRSNASLPQQEPPMNPPIPPPPEAPRAPQAAQHPPAPLSSPSLDQQTSGGKLSQILSAAGMDQDRMIILGLLLLLYNDGADHLLLLALLYLFL